MNRTPSSNLLRNLSSVSLPPLSLPPLSLPPLSLSPLALCALFACSTPTDPTGAGSGASSKTEHSPSSPRDAGARSPEGGSGDAGAGSEPQCKAAWIWFGSPEESSGILHCGPWQDLRVEGLPETCGGLGRGCPSFPESCDSDTCDCVNGSCECPPGYSLDADYVCTASPECDRHSDCGPGHLCVCASLAGMNAVTPTNECLPGNCTGPDDCGGYACAISYDEFEHNQGVWCHGPEDECQGNADCPEWRPTCGYVEAEQRWACVDIRPRVIDFAPWPQCSCGNLELDLGETCDDGNTVAGDGCSERCLLEGDDAE